MNEKRKLTKPKTLAGFQDLLPADAAVENNLISTVEQVFKVFAFSPIKTPHLEYTEMLLGDASDEISKQLFRFKDNGDRDVCLRFDLTIPLARYFVQHKNDLGLPFKRYAIGSCFRGERPQQGRFREFTQCDFDILGVDSVLADLEIAQVVGAGFDALGISDVTIKINSREVLNGFITHLGMESKAVELIRLFDKKDKISLDQFSQELIGLGCNDVRLTEVHDFFLLSEKYSSPLEVLNSLKEQIATEEFNAVADRLLEFFSLALADESLKNKVTLDLTLARGFGYYTGIVFETILNRAKAVGSVSGGGRYNNLTKSYSKDDIPGVGASFGISRIIAGLQMMGEQQDLSAPKVLVANIEKESQLKIIEITTALRAEGIKTECYLDVTKLKKQLQYADRKNIKYVIIIGSDELKNNQIQLKNLETKEQLTLDHLPEVIKHISS